jgi:hypothetical protein
MTAPADARPGISAEIDRLRRTLRWGYHFWYLLYLLFGGIAVLLPALAATGIWGDETTRLLAGFGAAWVALFTFLRPYEYASGFDKALQLVKKTKIAFDLGTIDAKEVQRRLHDALDMTTFDYKKVSPD